MSKLLPLKAMHFTKFNRVDMKKEFERQKKAGNRTFSYFSTEAQYFG